MLDEKICYSFVFTSHIAHALFTFNTYDSWQWSKQLSINRSGITKKWKDTAAKCPLSSLLWWRGKEKRIPHKHSGFLYIYFAQKILWLAVVGAPLSLKEKMQCYTTTIADVRLSSSLHPRDEHTHTRKALVGIPFFSLLSSRQTPPILWAFLLC